MLSRAERLNVREFAVAFEKGRVLRHPLLHLRFYQRRDGNKTQMRAAFVAPKKLGNAAIRNKIRRRARERFRLMTACDSLLSLQSCDLIFMATSECQNASGAQIDGALTELLKRAAKHAASS